MADFPPFIDFPFLRCYTHDIRKEATFRRHIMLNPTVMIGMSGGVDSSVAAMLLKQRGMDCAGATMQLWGGGDPTDARTIAAQLGIPHFVLELQEEFKNRVVNRFVEAYEQGLTPNPCILCNKTMKFGLMLEKAQAIGYDYVATGHYAKITRDPDSGRYLLKKAGDPAKDQTYFLYRLSQDQLAHTLFPLGELHKDQIRVMAEENGLITAHKRDSQDICFIPDGDYTAFLRQYTGKQYPSGEFVDLDGKVLGTHCGAVNYTIGQRRGLGIALGEPAYVCGKDMKANRVTLGPNEVLMSPALLADEMNWILPPEDQGPIRCSGKIRHSQYEQPATLYPQPDGSCIAVFDEPQRAISPGQAAVFYRGDTVICGGTIRKALSEKDL